MKKYILACAAIFCGLLLLQSCKKADAGPKNIELNETVKPGTTYALDLGRYSSGNDVAAITTQAEHYTISRIDRDAATGRDWYRFSITSKLQDKETVVITFAKTRGITGGFGGNCNKENAVVKINFAIQ